MKITSLLAVLALSLTVGCSKKNKDADVIVLGVNPAENVEVVKLHADALVKLVAERTGMKLKTFIATDYGALIEAMRSNNVQFAFLPPFSLVQAERVAGGKVLLRAVRKGSAFFYPAIITAKDYKSIDDLKGKTMAWTDPASASGHILAKSNLMARGINPDQYFSKQVFAGGHDALLLAVINKTVDAGATFCNDTEGLSCSWQQLLKDPNQQKKIKLLMTGKPVPSDSFATTETFYKSNPQVVEKLVSIMTELGKTPEGHKVLQDLYRIDSMEPAKTEDYEPVREAARLLKVF